SSSVVQFVKPEDSYAALEKLTGYVRGGCSPLGMKNNKG
ncbi:hypothetical protein NT04LS_3263, partial [Listeria seeligeri FSL S4-171]